MGTAMTQIFNKITKATAEGGDTLDNFAKTAGMSAEQFSSTWENNPTKALSAFIKGLSNTEGGAKGVLKALDSVGIKGIREADTIRRMSNNHKVLDEALKTGAKGWKENTALTDEAAIRYETMGSKLKMLRNTFVNFLRTVGDAVAPAIIKLSDILTGLFEKLQHTSKGTRIAIAVFAGLAAIIPPILISGGLLLVLLSNVAKSMIYLGGLSQGGGILAGLKVAFSSLLSPIGQVVSKIPLIGSALGVLSGPVGWITLALVGIGTALVVAYKKSETFRNIVNGALSAVVNGFKMLWSGVMSVLSPIGQAIARFGGQIASTFSKFWQQDGPMLTQAFRNILAIAGPIFRSLGNVVSSVFNGIRTVIVTVLSTLWTVISPIMQGIKTQFAIVFGFIKNIVVNVFNLIKGVINGALNIILGIVKIFGGLLTGNWRAVWQGILMIVRGVLNIILSVGKFILNQFLNVVKFIMASVKNSFATGITIAKNIVIGALRIMLSIAKGILSGLLAFVKFIWTSIKSATTTIWNLIKFAVINPVRALYRSVIKLFNSLRTSTINIFNAIKNFALKVWSIIKNRVITNAKLLWSGVRAAFVLLRKSVISIFNTIKNFALKLWSSVKNGVIARAKSLWNGVRNIFNALKKGTTAIFNAVKNFALKVWASIKNTVVSRAKALWSGVRNAWNNLKKGTTNIFKSVGSFMSSKWNSIKSGTVNKAKALWSGVKGAWGSLSKGTRNTMNAVGGFMSKKWKDIKSGTVDLVTGMKNKVTGVMNKMGDVIKSVTGKIGDFFGDMIKGVKTGLNKLIDGVNWVGGKLGMDKLPKIKLHTGTEHTNTTTNVVKNGKIARDTFATVGDKGRGNGPNGFRHEAIKYPNGKMALTPNRDTTAFLPKGSSVMNGAQTHSMLSGLPRFNNGTLSNKKPKKKKKGDNFFGDVWEGTKAGTKAATGKVVEGGKAVVNKSLEMAAKGKKWMEDKIGDVMDWIEKPGKLLDKVLEGVGLNLDGFGIKKAAELPYNMMKGMFGKLKKAAIDTFTSWMEDAAEGDGGYIDLSKGINFPFSPNGRAPGYPFAGPHMGVDINYIYDKLYSVLAGKATARKGWNGGFGNMVDIVKGATKVIYGHMSKHAFSGSKNVKPGDYLGVSGNSGRSSGPHLHFEVQKNGKPIDPLKWLKANDGGGGKSGKWNGDIKKALKIAGLPTSKAYVNAWAKQIQTESGGNPKALGGTDGLADGRAKGLVQVKPGTFNAYKAKGHGNIWNGLDNLIAGMRYAKARYGKGGMLGVIGKGHGYATGGLINSSGWYNIAEGGYPEWVIPTDPSRNSDAMKLLALAAQDIDSKNKRNKRPNQMRTPSTSNADNNEMINVMARQLEATQKQVELLTQLVASNQRLEQKPTGFNERDVSKAQGKKAQMMAYNMGGAF